MRKSILAALLMFALVAPSFAETLATAERVETLEIIGKVGYGFNAQVKHDGDTLDINSPYLLGAEGYLYLIPGLGLGGGITNIFDAEIADSNLPSDVKIGATNVYVSVKPKFGDFYLLGQMGYGVVRVPEALNVTNGLYWGVGAGIQLSTIIVEVLYSNTNFKAGFGSDPTTELTYSMIALNVGFRFAV